jgi:hypothetical protein
VTGLGGLDRVHRQGANGVGESALRRHEISQGSAGGGIRLADGLVPIVALHRGVNLAPTCGHSSICYAMATMSNTPLEEAMDRAERALIRIERAVERGTMPSSQDDHLREKVAGALAELDDIIREAGR